MSRIVLGKSGSAEVAIDLDVLLRTRLLVQANSGGGKSWLLRRLAEQLFGRVPVLIIDPEGEFATLREKFGYVLVGKGGETPADLRSAQLVAHKLLELGASAVCDIYELKPATRHQWVRAFLEALVDAPKNLWRPTVVIVDEAHVYCPEKGQGESEAYSAMQDLVTRGRKRGFCPVFATQRLAKLSKNVSAEMLNRLVGMTFEDVDLARAADLLSVPRAEQLDFFRLMKVMEPGQFWALGRAIAKDRQLLRVGPVATTHPEAGSNYSAAPPPLPDKVKSLLPKLADLPKAAEEKAKTEAELRSEIRSLKAQMAARPKEIVPKIETKRVEVPALSEGQIHRLENLADRLDAATKKTSEAASEVKLAIISGHKLAAAARGSVQVARPDRLQVHPEPARSLPPPRQADPPPDGAELTPAQYRILRALADFNALGRMYVPRTWVAALAGASHKSSSYANNLGALRARRLLDYRGGDIHLTDEGVQLIPPSNTPTTTEAALQACLKIATPAMGRILQAAYEVYPQVLAKEEAAVKSGQSATSSSFANNLGALRSAGMIEYVEGGIKCASWIFVDEIATAR